MTDSFAFLDSQTQATETTVADQEPPAKKQKKGSKPQLMHEIPVGAPNIVNRNVFLVQSQSSNLSLKGDAGAIGFLAVKKDHFQMDLKGEKFKGHVIPSNTFWVLNVGGAEAKIEAECQEYVQLSYEGSVYDNAPEDAVGNEGDLKLKSMDGMAAGLGRRQGKKKAKPKKK